MPDAFPTPAQLLPQEPPMVLIDEVVAWRGGSVTCRARLRHGQPFVVSGRASALVLLEYMAQAAGCNAGLAARERGDRIAVGLLLGTRELELGTTRLSVDDELEIHARHVFGDERLGSFECEVRRDDVIIGTAVLNVFAADRERMSELP